MCGSLSFREGKAPGVLEFVLRSSMKQQVRCAHLVQAQRCPFCPLGDVARCQGVRRALVSGPLVPAQAASHVTFRTSEFPPRRGRCKRQSALGPLLVEHLRRRVQPAWDRWPWCSGNRGSHTLWFHSEQKQNPLGVPRLGPVPRTSLPLLSACP